MSYQKLLIIGKKSPLEDSVWILIYPYREKKVLCSVVLIWRLALLRRTKTSVSEGKKLLKWGKNLQIMFCQNGVQRAKETVFCYLKDTLGETVFVNRGETAWLQSILNSSEEPACDKARAELFPSKPQTMPAESALRFSSIMEKENDI